MYMNTRLRAGLDVAAFVLGFMFVGITVRRLLSSLANMYGEDQVIHGIIFSLMTVALVGLLKLMYDIRVAQISSIEKLKQMVNK